MLLVDGQVRRQRRLRGEGESVRALRGRPYDGRTGATGGVEHVVCRRNVRLEHAGAGVALRRRDRRPVDDAVGVERGDEIPHLASVGDVDGAEREPVALRDFPAGVIEVDTDDAVAVARQAVADPPAGAAAAAGDEDGFRHA